jgi:NAD(P)H dehydrogenase (quinone)
VSIVVTGASGQLGRLVARRLLDLVAPSELILVTRHPEVLGQLRARGVTVCRGDFDDPESLATAFTGGERLLLMSTNATGRRVAQHRTAIAAAVGAGIRRLVYTSMGDPVPGHPFGVMADEHRESEAAVMASGLVWTILRNQAYADYLIPAGAAAIATGRLVTNIGEGRIAYVTRDDCARAAAVVLTSEGHAHAIYDITGPELLTQGQVASLLATVCGRPVEVVSVDDEAFIETLVAHGADERAARASTAFGAAAREGYLAQFSTAVQDLTGNPARSLHDLFESHRTELLVG